MTDSKRFGYEMAMSAALCVAVSCGGCGGGQKNVGLISGLPEATMSEPQLQARIDDFSKIPYVVTATTTEERQPFGRWNFSRGRGEAKPPRSRAGRSHDRWFRHLRRPQRRDCEGVLGKLNGSPWHPSGNSTDNSYGDSTGGAKPRTRRSERCPTSTDPRPGLSRLRSVRSHGAGRR